MVDETKENVRGDNVAFENAEVKILDTEKVLDTDPELYKNRALDAIEKQYYLDAMAEAEKAIQYGNNWPRYQAVKARVLLATEKYDECITYLLKGSDLWKRKDDMLELSNEDKDFVRYAFSVCYGQLGYPPEKLPEIILTADGRGMCGSIQEAVEKYSDKKIFLTGGFYNENLYIENKILDILGSYYSTPHINGRWNLKNCKILLKGVAFTNQDVSPGYILKIENCDYGLSNLSFAAVGNIDSIFSRNNVDSEQELIGIEIRGCESNQAMDGITCTSLSVAIEVSDTKIQIKDCRFERCGMGIGCHNLESDNKVVISNCVFSDNYVGCSSIRNGDVTIQHSEFKNNSIAAMVSLKGSKEENYHFEKAGRIKIINNSQIIGSRYAAIICDQGYCLLQDSTLKNNAKEYIEIGDSKYIKERVTEIGNTAAGPLKEGVKSIFKALFS